MRDLNTEDLQRATLNAAFRSIVESVGGAATQRSGYLQGTFTDRTRNGAIDKALEAALTLCLQGLIKLDGAIPEAADVKTTPLNPHRLGAGIMIDYRPEKTAGILTIDLR